jgi:hypothetical protein
MDKWVGKFKVGPKPNTLGHKLKLSPRPKINKFVENSNFSFHDLNLKCKFPFQKQIPN